MSSRSLGTLTLALAFTLAACTGTPSGGGTSPTASAAALPTKLTLVVPSEPPTLDSLRDSSGPVRNTIAANILETLVTIDPNTKQVQPNLAQSWKQSNPTTWRITLRTGVKFHDGSAMTADDVVASLKYTMVKGSAVWEGLIPNFLDAQKIDSSTVDITLKQEVPILPLQLQFVSVAPASAVGKGPESFGVSPVGTGAYKVVQWSKGTSLTLTRFDDYWGGPPQIKDVTVLWRTEPSVRADMSRTGEAQLAQSLRSTDLKDIPNVATVPGLDVYTLYLNAVGQTKDSVMKDIRVRQAVNHAIDRAALRDKIYGGYATLLKGNEVPPLVIGYNSALEDYAYDPAKARALVTEAGAAGKPLTFTCTGGRYTNDAEACQLITSQLNAVGLSVTMTNPAFAVWLESYRAGQRGQDRPDILFGGPGNSALDFPSVTGQIYLSLKAGGGAATVNDPSLDALIISAQKESDLAKRETLGQQISKVIRDQAYNAVLVAPNYIWGTAKNVDFKPRSDDYLHLKTVRYTN